MRSNTFVSERLETRQLLCASMIELRGDLLIVNADDGDQRLYIFEQGPSPNSNIVNFDANGDGDFTDPGDWMNKTVNATRFRINMGGGNDEVRLGARHSRHFDVDLGAGDDMFRFGTGVNPIAAGANITLNVYGQQGTDTFIIQPESMARNARFTANIRGGSGGDFLEFYQTGVIASKARVLLNAQLGAGADAAFIRNASPDATFDLQPGASLDYRIMGGADDDLLAYSNSPAVLGPHRFGGNLSLTLDGAGGNDVLRLELGRLDITGGNLQCRLSGGQGDDFLNLSGDVRPVSTSGRLLVSASGDGGNDFYNERLDDFGDGAFSRLQLNGGSGSNQGYLYGNMTRQVRGITLL